MELEEQAIELMLGFIQKHGDTHEHDQAGRILAEVRAERAKFVERVQAHAARSSESIAVGDESVARMTGEDLLEPDKEPPTE